MSRRGWPCALCWYSQEFPKVGVAVAAAWRSPCPCCSIKFRCHSRYNSRSSLARTHFAKRCGSMIFWFVAKTYVVYVYAWHKIFLSFSNVLTIVKIESFFCIALQLRSSWLSRRINESVREMTHWHRVFTWLPQLSRVRVDGQRRDTHVSIYCASTTRNVQHWTGFGWCVSTVDRLPTVCDIKWKPRENRKIW